jgi:hypothetical protein
MYRYTLAWLDDWSPSALAVKEGSMDPLTSLVTALAAGAAAAVQSTVEQAMLAEGDKPVAVTTPIVQAHLEGDDS